jgi:hypothetical protein
MFVGDYCMEDEGLEHGPIRAVCAFAFSDNE